MDITTVDFLMHKLDISKDEAIDLINADKRIDKGEKLFELTDEQQKASKQARISPRKPTVYNFSKRERKQDTEKIDLFNFLKDSLQSQEDISNIEIVNLGRELTFLKNNRKFKIVLSLPRT